MRFENYIEPDELNEEILVGSGLVWANSLVNIRLEADGIMDSLDVFIKVVSKESYGSVSLSLQRWAGRNRVQIIDLNGNKVGNPVHGRGYGTLAVNLGIQLVHFYFNIPMGDVCARQVQVTGHVSHEAAPGKPGSQEYEEDVARRIVFWRRFGFEINNTTTFGCYMTANLGDLRMVNGPDTPERVPRMLSLSTFSPAVES